MFGGGGENPVYLLQGDSEIRKLVTQAQEERRIRTDSKLVPKHLNRFGQTTERRQHAFEYSWCVYSLGPIGFIRI